MSTIMRAGNRAAEGARARRGYDPNCGISTLDRELDVSAGSTPFHDLSDFVAIPRVARLRLAPDGTWLAAAVQTLSADAKKYLTSIWRIDTHGGPARRLTRSAEGEASPRFLPDGSLLFTSRRPDPGRNKTGPSSDSDDVAALWLLPAAGGEARVVAALPGGVTAVEVARDAGGIVVRSPVLPMAGGSGPSGSGVSPGGRVSPRASSAGNESTAEDDARLRQERKDAGITAILHESAPVRYWDHDLGPDQPRLFAVDPDQVQETDIGWPGAEEGGEDQEHEGTERVAKPTRLRDLTPEPGRALDEEAFELTPDGTSVVTGWWHWDPAGESHCELVMIDVASGKRRVLLSGPEFDFSGPRVSPDGRFIVCQRERHATAEQPIEETLVVLDAGGSDAGGSDTGGSDTGGSDAGGWDEAGQAGRDLLPGYDRWPTEPAWSHDSRALYVAADDGGRRPVFRVDTETGEVTRVTGDDGAYTDLNPGPYRSDHGGRAGRAGVPRCPAYRARAAGGGAGDCGRRSADPVLARATSGSVGGPPGAPAALGARRADEQLEFLVLAVESSSDGRPRLRRAAARPGAVDRIRPGVHRPRAPRLGRQAVRRHHGRHRRRPGPSGHRRGPGRHDGRVLRRLHGELDGRPYRPLQGDREPRRAVDARGGVRHHGPPDVLAAAVRGPADQPGDVRGELAAPAHRPDPHADAGHPREQGLPGAGRRGAAAVVGPVAARGGGQVPVLP